MYRKISAHYVITGDGGLLKNGIITVDKSGKIVNIKSAGKSIKELSGMEFYNGVLVPGFVNAHCHLELSHLKGKIKQRTGLPDFVSQINMLRLSSDSEIQNRMKIADNEMFNNGIVAVGDIANKADSIDVKLNSKIYYHTFVELFTTDLSRVNSVWKKGKELCNSFVNSGLSASVTAHAPYSVHPELFDLIVGNSVKFNSIMSIHNQECSSENELFINKTGKLYEMFTSKGIDLQCFSTTGKSSLLSILGQLNKNVSTILVHNTFSSNDDVEFANEHFGKLYWCLCPNANLYIENKLPDIYTLHKMRQKICVGTDSLASNMRLSVLDELKVISAAFPEISLEELISWACLNGAQALNLDNELGSFEINKSPHINLIENLDLNRLKLTAESKLRKII